MISGLTRLVGAFSALKHWYLYGTIAITALGGALRFGNLANPKILVFDETYYVKDAWTLGQTGAERKWPENYDPSFELGQVSGYLQEASYVVHPPFGKWLIYFGMQLFGAESSFGWRFAVALLGTLAIPLIIITARLILNSKRFALTAGLFLAIEGTSIVMARTSILDGILAFFVLLGFLFFVLDQRYWAQRIKRGVSLGLRPFLVLSALSLGLATATKWSGLYFLAAFGLYSVLSDLLQRRSSGKRIWPVIPQGAINALTMIPVALAAYVASWTGWIASKDGWGRTESGNWISELWEYHKNAYGFHTGLDSAHPYEANALQWLVSARPTAFYFEKFEDCGFGPCTEAITAVPNPAIWLGGVLAAIWASYRFFAKRDQTAGLIAVGFLAGWAPWLLYLERTTFQFYTVVFVPFLILALSYALQRYLKTGYRLGISRLRERRITLFLLLSMLLGLYFLSIWMGLPVPHWVWQIQMWFPFWI